jgi:sugar/nucleoside kinase (ribokinase family)
MSQLFQPVAGRRVDILSLGNPNIDLVFAVAQAPRADQKCLGRRIGTFAGGTTSNVACAAGRLGARTSVYGRIGDDPEGQFLKAEFERFNVSTEHLRVVQGTSSATAIIMINEHGEKALIYVPMPEQQWGESLPVDLFAQSRIIYTMPYEIAIFGKVAQLAHQQGANVVIDVETAMVPNVDRLDALLGLSDVVFFSDSSFREILGSLPTSEVMQQLLRKGPRAIIVTLGAQGALAVTNDNVVRQPGFPAKVVDTTGAGDCFNGALLAATLEGQSLQQAMRFACAAASISLSAIGARSMLPDRETIASLLQSSPVG